MNQVLRKVKQPEQMPWVKGLPTKIENNHKLQTTHKIVQDWPGPKAPCPLCGRMVSTTREHHTRHYGSDNNQPADEWDSAITFHCSTVEPNDQGLTVYHDGNKKLLTDEEVAKTYQRHYT